MLTHFQPRAAERAPFYAPPTHGGTDLERMLAVLRPLAPSLQPEARPHKGPFRWRADGAAAGGLSTWRVRHDADCTIRWRAREDVLCLVFPLAGRLEATIGNETVTADPGSALLLAMPCGPETAAYAEDGRHARVTLTFGAAAVARVLSAALDGAELEELGLARLIDLSTPFGQTLRPLAEAMVCGMLGGALRQQPPEATGLLADAALRLILDHVPHRFARRRAHDVAPRHIKAAIGFMRANLHRPLTVTDIAAAAAISVRSLQIGFHRFHGTTPMSHLRQLRLQAAHAELSSNENRLSVGEIASKWGFTHLGRFAAQYRAAYGVHPSETRSSASAERPRR